VSCSNLPPKAQYAYIGDGGDFLIVRNNGGDPLPSSFSVGGPFVNIGGTPTVDGGSVQLIAFDVRPDFLTNPSASLSLTTGANFPMTNGQPFSAGLDVLTAASNLAPGGSVFVVVFVGMLGLSAVGFAMVMIRRVFRR
jgi:hypothetical protein